MDSFYLVLLTKNTSSLPILGSIWNVIVEILGMIMNVIYNTLESLGIGNIGLSIIIFTIVMRIILFPTSFRQQKSSRMMQLMQPEMKAIQEKYKNKTDNASMMAQQAEMKALYEKYGTSMTGGCLPLLLQMPVIFALYRIIMNIPAYVPSVYKIYSNVLNAIGGDSAAQKLVEFGNNNNLTAILKQLHNLGIEENASYSSEQVSNFIVDFLYKLNPTQWSNLASVFPDASQVIEKASADAERINNFLGINLSTAPSSMGLVPNVYWIIPILAGVFQYLSTKLMSSSNKALADGNDQSAQMMKSMNLTMPLMSVWFCFSFASGIGLYWCASSGVMIIQQLLLNNYFSKISDKEMIEKQIAAANAKRAKKGLAPIDEKSVENRILAAKDKAETSENNRLEVIAKQNYKTKESTDYYNKNAKPGSLASKANMVQLYNEKNEKSDKK
ncbi:YidC/Oxa1 family membrane protein insertase [Oribacterium sp. KHPX15]|uniref:YidC/Oxa1 family membrane protein insertase n=1 Tax=Oribacterium sp. KHPX15 TaxID=1855342 RepID=UPI0008952BD1|nr:YidC/Oxa1 family membrane protein insertase [Oribacterium sp. KHPX15]SEA82277.1 YidC/Oxa1 family membrane protein insertase [Oribacterium sp. KHPX15]